MKPGERQAWKMVRQTDDREIDEGPHREDQPIIDYLERPYGDEDYDDTFDGRMNLDLDDD